MNHIAHCLLSHPDGDDLLGNFIGDVVKGKSWELYPVGVQAGILRHRSIDAFTDAHPVVRESVDRVRPFAGKFSAPVVDILYDHLLYLHWTEYTSVAYDDFEVWVYRELEMRKDLMPGVMRERWPRMLGGRFLRSYATERSMRMVLDRFAARLPLPVDAEGLMAFFFNELPSFESDFKAFFPELQKHAGRVPA